MTLQQQNITQILARGQHNGIINEIYKAQRKNQQVWNNKQTKLQNYNNYASESVDLPVDESGL